MKRTRSTLAPALALALAACGSQTTSATTDNRVTVAVQLAQAKPVETVPREEVTGTLQPAKALKLGFEVGGRLSHLRAAKGARLAEGQLIAELDPEIADAQVRQAEAAVAAAAAQSAMASDVAQRNGELAKTGNVSALQSANSKSTAAGAAAQLLAAQAQLAQAQAARRRHELRAPFAATLIDAPEQVGETVGPGVPLFTLEQLDSLVLKSTVPEGDLAAIHLGAKVHVEEVAGSAATDDASVRLVLSSADAATRRLPIEIAVPNADGRFIAHTLARAILPVGSAENGQSIPASALSSSGGDHVFVLDAAGAVHRLDVTVIDRGTERVTVQAKSPLDRLVDFPGPDLTEGLKVTVR